MADPVYNPNLTIPISSSVAPPQIGPQTIIVTYPKRSSRREGYRSKPSQICGILLIMSGVGAIITQSVGFAIQMKKYNIAYRSYRFVGEGYFGWTGVWTSLFAFLAGSFAIVSSKTKRVGFIITTLVMSILSAVCVVFVIGMSSWIIADQGNSLKGLKYDDWWDHWSRTDYSDMSYMIKESIATAFFMLLCGIMEFSCSVFLSTLCCKVCCSNRQEAVTGNNSQVIFMNNAPVPIGSQPLHMTNPETQVLMSPPMYAPGQSVFQASGGKDLSVFQASGGKDLPPPYTDAEMQKSDLPLDAQYSEKVPLTD